MCAQRAAPLTFFTLHLLSQASGDAPTTPKHPKDSRENFFPATVAPTAPDPLPADALQRPSDSHLKPQTVLSSATAVIGCPPSASASTPDLSTDPGIPRPHRPEATTSMTSLSSGKCLLNPPGNLRSSYSTFPEPSPLYQQFFPVELAKRHGGCSPEPLG